MDKDIIEKEFMNVYHKVFRDLESIIKDVNYANIDGIINDEDRKYYINNLWEIKKYTEHRMIDHLKEYDKKLKSNS